MQRHLPILLAALVCGLAAAPSRADDAGLARQAYQVLNKHCYECHGLTSQRPPRVLKHDSLTARNRRGLAYVVPHKPDESYLWERIKTDEMPPEAEGKLPLQPEEKEVVRKWIEAGAPPFPEPTQRALKSGREVLGDIGKHLRGLDAADRKFQRYFTLAHLHNNATLSDVQLRSYRAALSKVVNSLSWEPDLVLPKALDEQGTVYQIDLRHLGWQQRPGRPDVWREVLNQYPYGVKRDRDRDPALRRAAEEVYELAGGTLPYVRADWFVVAASRPPLYHTLLELPATAEELEKKLDVDVEANFRDNRLARAGFMSSGVSRQNRLIERHPTPHGAYWKSYDFKTSGGLGNLLRFPLGPRFKGNPFEAQAFSHAGGEIIFHLPNGLQGYLLVDQEDKRLDRAPVDIVRDPRETGGTPEVVNGVSCISCHQRGMIVGFKDVLRERSGVFGEARVKLQELHPTAEQLERLLEKDERRFLQALEGATGPFLKVGEDKGRDIGKFDEPVGAVVRLYQKDLDLAEAAAELGLEDPETLRQMIDRNPRLRQMGLGPLVEKDGAIKREVWDFRQQHLSLFQQLALECDLGYPVSSGLSSSKGSESP